MSPKHSIHFCPICGGGLCGIRICGVADEDKSDVADASFVSTGSTEPHGLVICDECEAIWLEPDVMSVHQYPDLDDSLCPICSLPLWGMQSRWATTEDIEKLGWTFAVNPDLDYQDDEGFA